MNVATVIPAFNERERLPPFLASIQERFANVADYEVIVVDDGSVDGSSEYLKDLSGHWPQLKCVRLQENRGKSAAVRAGVLASEARLVLISDADGAAPIDELAPMIAVLDSGADIVCGSRTAGPNVRRGILRRVASVAFSVVVRSIVGSKSAIRNAGSSCSAATSRAASSA